MSFSQWFRWGTAGFLIALFGVSQLQADDGLNAAQLASLIYQRTSTANTEEDLTVVVEASQRLAEIATTDDYRKYAKENLSWSYNRRGELRSDRAVELYEQGFDEVAATWEVGAKSDFDRAIASNPNHWRAWQNRGIARATNGELRMALADFTRVLALNPTYANAAINRAEVSFELGRYTEALNDFNKFLTLSPGDAAAHTGRAHTLFQLGRFKDSLVDYQRAVELSPQSANVYADRGDVYQHMHQWSKAHQDYQQALAIDADLYRTQRNLAWLLATTPDVQIQNGPKAVEYATAALKHEGDEPNWRTLDILAAAQARAGNFAAAQEKIELAIRKAPKSQQEILRQRSGQYLTEKPVTQTE